MTSAPATLEEANAVIFALTAEKKVLLQKHRAVCRCCAALDENPSMILKDFLEKYKTPKTDD